jgi:antitoxin component YwqK of YwqJK toxin-antitoxin module
MAVAYEGEWKNGEWHGKGKLYYNGNVEYEGEWENDLPVNLIKKI